ncbi:MAG: neutral zinc metallopeptidase [Gammaproteobacteria bacterium]|nr:neutral zinc metallopeptidase [Gammaproteobacteria bacterium]
MGQGQGGRRGKVAGPGGISAGSRRLLLGGIAAVIFGLVVAYVLGTDRTAPPGPADAGDGRAGSSAALSGQMSGRLSGPAPGADPEEAFVSTVLDDTEDAWSAIFRASGTTYPPPALLTFNGAIPSACGYTQVAMGPFYCAAERKLYIDLDFLRELRQRFPAPGDYAAAYVIAHEIGHHVQNLLGTTRMVEQMLEPSDEEETGELPDAREIVPLDAREITLMVELQADCYAGMWAKNAHSVRQLVGQGDAEKALAAATTIGNDLLQQKARGYVMPDSFTHGTAAQRLRWFRTGLTTGDVESCETFAVPAL